MSRRLGTPAFRRRVMRGKAKAIVTLTDCITRRRRDFLLGPADSAEAHARYARLVARWEADGRRLPGPAAHALAADEPTVTQVCHSYLVSIAGRYSPNEERLIRGTARLLWEQFGSTPAASFGPLALARLRETMIAGEPEPKPAEGQPPGKRSPGRRPWCRSSINKALHRLAAIFKWAAAQEILPAGVYQALKTLEPLRRGRSAARETEPVRPVPDAYVDAVLPYLAPQVRAMVELQRLTGMRSGEVCIMRTRDVDTTGAVWFYTPATHKTAHHGHDRRVALGPKTQNVLKPWFRRALDEYLFQPREVIEALRAARAAARQTPAGQGNGPGTNRREDPRHVPGERYDAGSYAHAIRRACRAADVPHWHPHQLRHSYATMVRKQFGIEAAQILLGHHSLPVAELYAERDSTVGEKIAAKIG